MHAVCGVLCVASCAELHNACMSCVLVLWLSVYPSNVLSVFASATKTTNGSTCYCIIMTAMWWRVRLQQYIFTKTHSLMQTWHHWLYSPYLLCTVWTCFNSTVTCETATRDW